MKAAVLVALKDHPLLQARGDLDTAVYVALAKRSTSQPFFVSPLYLYFLRILDVSLLAARIVQIVLGSVAVVLIFDTARRWFGESAATISASLAILTGVITFYEVTVLQAALDPFLVALALWLLTIALDCGRPARLPLGVSPDGSSKSPAETAVDRRARRPLSIWFGLTGVALGLLAINRPNAALWMPVLVLGVLWLCSWRPAIILAVTFFVPIAPVAIRNYVVAHQLVIIASHGGLNFYIGNNAEADGTYHHVPGIRPTIAGQEEDAPRVAAAAMHGSAVTPEEASSFFYSQAWQWIRSNPGDALGLFIRKIAYTFNRTDLALNYSYSFFSSDVRSPLSLLFVGPWLLFPLGLAGAGRNLRDRRFAIWATFIPVYALSVAIFFVSSRYRLPLLIPMCITAGAMFVRPRIISWIALIGIAVCWNFGLDDGRAHERTNYVVYFIEQHRFDAANEWINATATMTRDPGTLYLRSALAFEATGARDRELAMFDAMASSPRTPEQSTEAARIVRAIGVADVKSDRGEEALRAFDAAHRLDPTDASDLLNIAVLQAQKGDFAAARENARAALALRPNYPQAEGLLNAIAGR